MPEKTEVFGFDVHQLVELPDELFDVLDTQSTNFNFGYNPLSAAAKQRVSEYDDNSSLYRKVLIQFDDEIEL